MKITGQIAAETRRRIFEECGLKRDNGEFDARIDAIIQSTIEKTHQEGWYEGRNYEAKYRIARASEPFREKLGTLVRKRLETLAHDLPIDTGRVHEACELLRAEAKSIEQVIKEFPCS